MSITGQLGLVVLFEGGYCARPQMHFPVLEILIEFEEADQRIRGFVLLTQKHLLCMKTSRKCLLTSCYFCVTMTF